MFVQTGAREKLLEKRREHFYTQYIPEMIREAEKLGITMEKLIEAIRKGGGER